MVNNYILIFLLIVIVLTPIIVERGLKIYHLGILTGVVYFIQYGLSSIYILTVPTLYLSLKNYVPNIDNALIFIVLTLLLFMLGFYSPYYSTKIRRFIMIIINKLPKANDYEINLKHFPMVIFALELFGWLARIVLIKMGAYYLVEVSNTVRLPGNFVLYASYIAMVSYFPLLCISLVFLTWLRTNKVLYLILSVILIVLEIIYALPSGMKMKIVQPIFNVLLLYSFKRKVPVIPVVLAFIFFIIFVFPFVTIYRSLLLRGDITYDLGVAYSLYKLFLMNFNFQSLNEILFYLFGERMNQISVLSVVVDNTPRVWDFKYGYTYLIFFLSFIPRFFWVNKPTISNLGNLFGRDYGLLNPLDTSTCIRIPWVAELFLNFGWFGILFAFFLGFIYQLLYSYFMRNGTVTSFSVILYIVGLFYLVEGESMVSDTFGKIFKICIVFFVISYPFLRKKKT